MPSKDLKNQSNSMSMYCVHSFQVLLHVKVPQAKAKKDTNTETKD